MTEQEIYHNFIAWLGKTWWGLPESDQLLPLIKARYSVAEAAFLTGMPFSGNNLAELAESVRRLFSMTTCVSVAVCVFTSARRIH